VNFGLLEGGVQRATALRATAADLPLPELRRNVLAPQAAPLLSSYRGARYAAVVQAAASYPPLPRCPAAPLPRCADAGDPYPRAHPFRPDVRYVCLCAGAGVSTKPFAMLPPARGPVPTAQKPSGRDRALVTVFETALIMAHRYRQ
jgi:hypothetical protein